MTFDAAAVQALFDTIQSHAMSLGLFETVNTHEAKNAPGHGTWCNIWMQSIAPVRSSGLATTSGRIELKARIGAGAMTQPADGIDPKVTSAAITLIGEYSGNFTLGGTARAIDLFGAEGTPLSSTAGYVQIDNKYYRVMEVTVPVIINDLWTQNG